MSDFSFAWDGPKPPPSEPLPPAERPVLRVQQYGDRQWYCFDRENSSFYLKGGTLRKNDHEFYQSKEEAVEKARDAGYIVENPS